MDPIITKKKKKFKKISQEKTLKNLITQEESHKFSLKKRIKNLSVIALLKIVKWIKNQYFKNRMMFIIRTLH